MIDSATLLGADPETAKKEMRDVLEFQTKVANVSFQENFKTLQNNIHPFH